MDSNSIVADKLNTNSTGMMRKMRRVDRELNENEAVEVIEHSNYAVLSCCDLNGFPYGVPVNAFVHKGRIYFHCSSKGGRKTAILSENPKVSLCFVCGEKVDPEHFSTDYASAIVAGRTYEITDESERREAALALCRRFCPHNSETENLEFFEKHAKSTSFWCIEPIVITGKSRNFVSFKSKF